MQKVICPYCGRVAKYVDSSVIYYGHSYGMASFNGNNPRSNSRTNIGFRAALPHSQILQARGLALSTEG